MVKHLRLVTLVCLMTEIQQDNHLVAPGGAQPSRLSMIREAFSASNRQAHTLEKDLQSNRPFSLTAVISLKWAQPEYHLMQ